MQMNYTSKSDRSAWLIVLAGFLIGVGCIAPGISGGAIAVTFGLYHEITDTIAHLRSTWRQRLPFFSLLGSGAVLGILVFGVLLGFLFDHYEMQTRLFFLGLMAGTLPELFSTANQKGFRPWYLILMLVGAGVTMFLGMPELFGMDMGHMLADAGEMSWITLLICGAVLGFGTIVPGVSASFILMAAGWYEPLLKMVDVTYLAANPGDWWKLIPLGAGFLLLVVLFSKAVNYVYAKAYGAASYTVMGLLLGSMVPVALHPSVATSFAADGRTISAVLLALVGAALTWLLMRHGAAEE